MLLPVVFGSGEHSMNEGSAYRIVISAFGIAALAGLSSGIMGFVLAHSRADLIEAGTDIVFGLAFAVVAYINWRRLRTTRSSS